MSRKACGTTCRYCGRAWDHTGRSRTGIGSRSGGSNAFGFVVAAKLSHERSCARLTPAERRKANEVAERRWGKKSPRSKIRNDPKHPGLRP